VKAAVAQRARELGFDACGFTTAAPPVSGRFLEDWLKAGYHGSMAYLERHAARRIDPQLVLPGARSIVTLAVSYQIRATANTPRDPTQGVVARYARYRDYHAVLESRLAALAEFINQGGGEGTRSLGYVDTGPLLERDLAQRAGLGFIGKHTNLISRTLGNWFFLCEILTTVELEPDAPEKNRCGTCVRCIEACPTRAIVRPFRLDARRCISYLTIELKGSIPDEFRPLIGRRIFGCDDCLEVCPWNRFAREGRLMQGYRRGDLESPDLIELLSLDEKAFKRRFADTPLARVKRRGLRRNACVALGNMGNVASLPPLRTAASDPELLVAEHARWAIAQIERNHLGDQGKKNAGPAHHTNAGPARG
jgi:epoxyqueuosine reductase